METEPAMTETRSIAATRAIGWAEAVYILWGMKQKRDQEILIKAPDHEQADGVVLTVFRAWGYQAGGWGRRRLRLGVRRQFGL
jgi:hypothetical protein